jgi:hypothetical protein
MRKKVKRRELDMHKYIPDFIVIAFYACISCLLVATANTIVKADGMSEQEWDKAEKSIEQIEGASEERKAQLNSLNEERLQGLIDELKEGQKSAVNKKELLTQ